MKIILASDGSLSTQLQPIVESLNNVASTIKFEVLTSQFRFLATLFLILEVTRDCNYQKQRLITSLW